MLSTAAARPPALPRCGTLACTSRYRQQGTPVSSCFRPRLEIYLRLRLRPCQGLSVSRGISCLFRGSAAASYLRNCSAQALRYKSSLAFATTSLKPPAAVFASKPAMVASIIDGTAVARKIRERLKTEIQQIQQTNPRFKPSLVIFQGEIDCQRCAEVLKFNGCCAEVYMELY